MISPYLLFLISLLSTIILHELAHFIVAKLCKCGIEEISFGFGKPILEKKIKEVYYKIKIIPFGAEVKLKGELDYSEDNDAFLNLTLRKKIFISLAGVFLNIALGLICGIIGIKTFNYNLFYFGAFSFIAGMINLIPTFPCIDGSYLIYYPIILKKFGKIMGIEIIKTIVKLSLKIVIMINILSLPIIIYLLIIKKLW